MLDLLDQQSRSSYNYQNPHPEGEAHVDNVDHDVHNLLEQHVDMSSVPHSDTSHVEVPHDNLIYHTLMGSSYNCGLEAIRYHRCFY